MDRPLCFSILLACVAALVSPGTIMHAAIAQSEPANRCMNCDGTEGSSNPGMNPRGLFGSDGPSAAQQARQQRLTEAYNLNQQAIDFQKSGDWARAAALFEQAAAKSPDDPVIRQNLANARGELASTQARLESQLREKAAAGHMQQAIQNFARTLGTAPSAGGLDFDGGNSGPPSSGLDFASDLAARAPAKPGCAQPGDTRTVGACNVPSDLPNDVEAAIAGAYENAPPGVSDRVRKGYQSVMAHDWKAAKAWFQDALGRDPGNAGLTRLIALSDHALPDSKTASTTARTAPGTQGYKPSRADIDEFAKNIHEGRYTLPLEARVYFWTLPDAEFRRVLALPSAGQLQLPSDDDVKFLFPGVVPDASTPPPALLQVLRATILHVEIDPEGERLVRAYAAQFK